jgi:hypothetical protein
MYVEASPLVVDPSGLIVEVPRRLAGHGVRAGLLKGVMKEAEAVRARRHVGVDLENEGLSRLSKPQVAGRAGSPVPGKSEHLDGKVSLAHERHALIAGGAVHEEDLCGGGVESMHGVEAPGKVGRAVEVGDAQGDG